MPTNTGARAALLTVRETAEMLRCSEQTVRRRIREGELPAAKLGRGRNSAVRVPRAAIGTWLWSGDVEERA